MIHIKLLQTKLSKPQLVVSSIIIFGLVLFGVLHVSQRPSPMPESTANWSTNLKKVALLPETTAKPVAATSPTSTACRNNVSGKLLLVSISLQHLWACDSTAQVYDSAVTTGTTAIVNGVDDATPTGTWQIYSKETNQHLRGSDANGSWDDAVQYWMPFDDEVGFHDASWQTFPFGSADYQTNGSHGCVHLPITTAAWVYNWAPIGTTVTVEV